MAERMTGLSVDKLFSGNHNNPLIPAFIGEFSKTLYSRDGRRPQLLQDFGVDIDFPVKLLVGVPKKTFTREQRLLAEAYASHFFDVPLGKDTEAIWTARPQWKPVNPNRVAATIYKSKLDTEWMLSLGIDGPAWDTILSATGIIQRANNKQPESSVLRHLLALSVYGFSDPHQFLTSIAR